MPANPRSPYRILVTGSDWDDEQELRLALISAAFLRLPAVVVVHGTDAAGAMAAEWASNYGLRTERTGEAAPDVHLSFGDDPDAGRFPGVRIRRFPCAAVPPGSGP